MKIGYKTQQFFSEDGTRNVQFRDIIIFKQFPDGTIELNAGNWFTATTKKKINQQLPPMLEIGLKGYKWIVTTPFGDVQFKNQIRFDKNGRVRNE